MTQSEFIADYGYKDLFDNGRRLALPCKCGEEDCKGWASVSNDPISLKAHTDLYHKFYS
jgi:hypothetical protein